MTISLSRSAGKKNSGNLKRKKSGSVVLSRKNQGNMVSRQVVAFSEACSVQQAALLLVINYQITEAEKMAKRIYLGQALVHMARRMNTGGQLGAI